MRRRPRPIKAGSTYVNTFHKVLAVCGFAGYVALYRVVWTAPEASESPPLREVSPVLAAAPPPATLDAPPAAPPPDAPAAPPPLSTIAPIASAPIAPAFSHALDLDQHRAAPAAARSPDPTAHPWAPPSSTPPRLRPAAAAAPSAPDAAAAVEEPAELGIEAWAASVSRKSRQCVQNRHGALYLYHARKAAGTSLRERLQASARAHRVELLETEGVTLDERFLELDGVVSATTLRDPVERAVSMYWYEHVGWWDGIQHDPSKLKTLHDWVETWRDGSEWKRSFVAKRENRRSVYVEVENYFVKSLSGFEHKPDGSARVGPRELAMAKAALVRFDVVLRVEDLSPAAPSADSAVALLLDAVVLPPGREQAGPTAKVSHALKGDAEPKRRLGPKLAKDEAAVRETLREINRWDLELMQFADRLIAARQRRAKRGLEDNAQDAARTCASQLGKDLRDQLGIFRPVGHKQ